MMKVLCWAIALSMTALAWGAVPAKKKASVRKPSSAAKKTTTKKAAAKKPTASKTSAARRPSTKKAPATTWRNRQTSPTSDRYREIQDALVSKGYLQPENVSGSWDQASVDAMKRFQADQKIDTNGKINSLSLIALGLGPKRDTVVTLPTQEQIPNH